MSIFDGIFKWGTNSPQGLSNTNAAAEVQQAAANLMQQTPNTGLQASNVLSTYTDARRKELKELVREVVREEMADGKFQELLVKIVGGQE